MPCVPAKIAKESKSLHLTHIFHSIFSILSLLTQPYNYKPHSSTQLGNFNPTSYPRTNSFPDYWCISEQASLYFQTTFFLNVLKTFMLVPKGSLLLFCYALISLFLPLPAGGSTLLFIFCLSDLCVDGIHLAYPLFFTLLWRQAATVWCSY